MPFIRCALFTDAYRECLNHSVGIFERSVTVGEIVVGENTYTTIADFYAALENLTI